MKSIFALSALSAAFAVVPPYNLVDLLANNPDQSTLVTAVVAGGLAGTLSGAGPFTVFAPDNFAFDRLPQGVLPALLKNVTLLDEVLTYHVVSGNVSSSQLTDGEQVPTLDNQNIFVNVDKSPRGTFVTLDRQSQVIYADNYATNGVYHVIDRVLIPKNLDLVSEGLRALLTPKKVTAAIPGLDLVGRLSLIPQFSTLVTAVAAGGLVPTLQGKGPFTIFAPNDFAFQRLPPGELQKLLANVTLLDQVLTYHVVAGNVSSSQLTNGEKVPTVEGATIDVAIYTAPNQPAQVVLNQRSHVLNANNYATNGVFHEIDEVLLPF